MAQQGFYGSKKWRTNRQYNYSSQSDNYPGEFTTASGGHRQSRQDQTNVYQRDIDQGQAEPDPWSQQRMVAPASSAAHYNYEERGSQQGWRQHAGHQGMRGNDQSYTRDFSRPFHAHNETHNTNTVVSQQWRDPHVETASQWREREREVVPDYDRSRPARSMDWEAAPNHGGWEEHPPTAPTAHFQQQMHSHQDVWAQSSTAEWQEQNQWPRHPGRQYDNRQGFQQHNKRHQNGYSHYENNKQVRPKHWNKYKHQNSEQYRSNDHNEARSQESPVKQNYPRKGEKRRHSRTPSPDSKRDNRTSLSPKRRRRETPPATSKGVYTRRSRSRQSREGHERQNRDTKQKREPNGRNEPTRPANQQHARSSKHKDREPRGWNDRDKKKHGEARSLSPSSGSGSRSTSRSRGRSPNRARSWSGSQGSSHSRSRTRSRSRPRNRSLTIRSRSKSRSRSRSKSRDKRRPEGRYKRKHSASPSRSRSPPSPQVVSNRAKNAVSKHRLPTKTAPKIPLLKDVPLAASRAVIPNPPTAPRARSQARSDSASTNTIDNALQTEQKSALSQFFPDAAPRASKGHPPPNSQVTKTPPGEPDDPSSTNIPVNVNAGEAAYGEATVGTAAPQPAGNKPPARESGMGPPPTRPGAKETPALVLDTTSKVSMDPGPSPSLKTAQATPLASETPSQPKPRKTEDLYKIMSQVGEGTFGKVYKARNQLSGIHVALKRIRMEGEKDGFPVTAMREIKLLQSLKHDNVVKLHEMMVSKGLVYMVLEYAHHDLVGVLQQTQFILEPSHLKALSMQMLSGLAYLHLKGIIHRDLKASNILINSEGQLKLADFGLARFYQKRRRADYTNRVITLWYRPPELLLGATVYGPEVDIWSAGCIFLELFVKKPTFQGNDEIHQLDVIYQVMGTPSVTSWPSLPTLPWYELVKPTIVMANVFQKTFSRWLPPGALDIAEQMLTFDPGMRVTAADAVMHSYFVSEEPLPEPPNLSHVEGEWHELEAKKYKRKRRAEADADALDSAVPNETSDKQLQ